MGRGELLAELSDYRPYDEAEAVSLERMIDFVSAHCDCFDRTLKVGHMTAGAWLVDESGERALLTHHKKLDKWLQLGGHADGCSDLRVVALREAREESGIESIEFAVDGLFDVDVHLIPDRSNEPEHDHYDVRFLMHVVGDPSFRVSDESHALGWFTRGQLATMELDASVRRLIAKWPASELFRSRGVADSCGRA